jgi:competence protein ComFA
MSVANIFAALMHITEWRDAMRFIYDGMKLIPQPLAKECQGEAKPISRIQEIPSCTRNPHFSFSAELLSFLEGKHLLLDELPFPLDLIHTHYEHGYVSYEKGIAQTEKGYRCGRCGNEKEHLFASFFCARCETTCTYCRQCITMGRVSECTPLIVSCLPVSAAVYEQALAWNGMLSQGQQMAAEAVVEAVERQDELLVWAVCGAGKTEVLFPGIHQALQLG